MKNQIESLRFCSRKLLRELGILGIEDQTDFSPGHWHALIEIDQEPGITISKLRTLLIMSLSRISRITKALLNEGLVESNPGADKREKYLHITPLGKKALKRIDEYSRKKIEGAFEYMNEQEIRALIESIEKYAGALEKSRLFAEQVKIATLSTSRTIRKQIISMIENIQRNEFSIQVSESANLCILKAEENYYFNKTYNFWYAVDESGKIIGSIGLRQIDEETGQVKKFFVAKEYRGKGIAQKLMESMRKAALKHGFHTLYLGTVDVLKAAHKFYDKAGFERIAKTELPNGFELIPVDTVFFKGSPEHLQF